MEGKLMTHNRQWNTVRLALTGVPESNVVQAISDLQETLDSFPHLRNVKVTWDQMEKRITVQLEVEDWKTEGASARASEELHELIPAVFAQVEGVRVESLNTSVADNQ
jgi:hypothetical protein